MSVVAILFTDLVGSTEMLSRLGEDAFEALRQEHFHLSRDAIGAHDGENRLRSVTHTATTAVELARAVEV